MSAIKAASRIVWERKDGLYSAATLSEHAFNDGFDWFASDFQSSAEAHAALPEREGETLTFLQDSMSDEDRNLINVNVARSCEALTPEQVTEGVTYGSIDLDFLTKNETTVLKTFHDYEYMDDGLDTELNYDWAVSEGVQGSTGVTARGASGVISSLVKKGFFTAQDNGAGEDDFIIFHESARIVNRLLNAEGE